MWIFLERRRLVSSWHVQENSYTEKINSPPFSCPSYTEGTKIDSDSVSGGVATPTTADCHRRITNDLHYYVKSLLETSGVIDDDMSELRRRRAKSSTPLIIYIKMINTELSFQPVQVLVTGFPSCCTPFLTSRKYHHELLLISISLVKVSLFLSRFGSDKSIMSYRGKITLCN